MSDKVSRKVLLDWISDNQEMEITAVGADLISSQVRCELWGEIKRHIDNMPTQSDITDLAIKALERIANDNLWTTAQLEWQSLAKSTLLDIRKV